MSEDKKNTRTLPSTGAFPTNVQEAPMIAQQPERCGHYQICVYVSDRIRRGKSDAFACPVDAKLEQHCKYDTRSRPLAQQPTDALLDKRLGEIYRGFEERVFGKNKSFLYCESVDAEYQRMKKEIGSALRNSRLEK